MTPPLSDAQLDAAAAALVRQSVDVRGLELEERRAAEEKREGEAKGWEGSLRREVGRFVSGRRR